MPPLPKPDGPKDGKWRRRLQCHAHLRELHYDEGNVLAWNDLEAGSQRNRVPNLIQRTRRCLLECPEGSLGFLQLRAHQTGLSEIQRASYDKP